MMDALSLLPEYEKDRFDSRHRLVIAASQRAKHLLSGARQSWQSKFTKETTIALDEVLRHQVPFLVGKDARQAMKEAKRGVEHEMERMGLAPAADEDGREIKKDLSVYVDDSAGAAEPDAEE